MLKKTQRDAIQLVISVFLFAMPFFWTLSTVFNIGGDDSRLYLIFPDMWLNNITKYSWFSLSAFSSYNPQYAFLGFNFVTIVLNKIFFMLNIQKLLFGLTLVFQFKSMQLLIKEIICNKDTDDSFYASIVGSLLYVFIPIIYYIEWPQPLYSLYGIFTYPLLLLFLIKSIRTKKTSYIIYGSFIATIFGVSLFNIPWLVPFFLASLIFILLYFIFVESNRFSIVKYSFLYLIILFFLNLFWILPFLSGFLFSNEQISYATSESGVIGAHMIVNAVAPSMNIYDTLSGLLSRGLIYDWGWSHIEIADYTYRLAPLSILLTIFVFAGFIIGTKHTQLKQDKKILAIHGITTLILVYFQTVNIGNWGIPLFNWLIDNLPGWVMFRNFYGKFPITFGIFYSLTFSMSLYIILQSISQKSIKKILVLSISVIILLQAVPFIRGDINSLTPYPDIDLTRNVEIPQYYLDSMDYIKHVDSDSKILTLPLTIAQYSIFESTDNKGVYIGVSPIKIFTGKDDFSGKMSFDNSFIPELPNIVQSAMISHDYDTISRIMGILNIGYVVHNEDISDSVHKRYMWEYETFSNNTEMKMLIGGITDGTISSFGPMSIFYAEDNYFLPHIYAASSYLEINEINQFPQWLQSDDFKPKTNVLIINEQNRNTKLEFIQSSKSPEIIFEKISPVKYKIEVNDANEPFYLVFLESYHSGWNVYQGNIEWYDTFWKKSIDADSQFIANGYANGWPINNTGTYELTLYFWPQNIFYIGALISLLTVNLCVLYLFYRSRSRLQAKWFNLLKFYRG